MNKLNERIGQLYSIRNKYGKQWAAKKIQLLHAISGQPVKSKKALRSYYDTLLFLIAYPENKNILTLARQSLQQLGSYISSRENIKYSLYNSGITGSSLCAAFSFEMVKWLRKKHRSDIKLRSFDAVDSQIQSILSVVMSKTESEILQDANAEWKGWLKRSRKKGEDVLDQLIAIFDSSSIRPEVKDELWNTIGINTEINFPTHCSLPDSLIVPYYHRSLIRSHIQQQPVLKPTLVKLNEEAAEQIINCARLILVRHLRELDPISFTSVKLLSYYQLQRGLSIALMGMAHERRHPVDSYMGYVVFKNGLPVSYAGSWILFDSARISLNVFPSYRGGESQYIFQQALQLHKQVYRLKRFSVDPYQLGKENSDGIHSGAFWVYYHAGFRPLLKIQQELAATEAVKIKNTPGYRTQVSILEKLAQSRLELMMDKRAVSFDAGDLSIAWADIIAKKYNNNRKLAATNAIKKLAAILQIKNYQEEKMNFVLQNWSLLLLANEKELRSNVAIKRELKKLFVLKADGSEGEYIAAMQHASGVRKYLEEVCKEFIFPGI